MEIFVHSIPKTHPKINEPAALLMDFGAPGAG
jgi:hypothetical protein